MKTSAMSDEWKRRFSELKERLRALAVMGKYLRTALKKEENRDAFRFLRKRLAEVLWDLRPHRGGMLTAALGDPYKQGVLTSVMAVLYPFYGDRIDFEPDFQSEATEIRLDLSGKMHLIVLVTACVRSLLSRNVRNLFAELKKMKEMGETYGKE